MVKNILNELAEMYEADNLPWVIGFSGGKDSSTVLQLIFHAVSKMPMEKRIKPIHVVSNDTLVENPVVQKHIDRELVKIRDAGKSVLYPHNPDLFIVEKTTPAINDTFWVNLIGKGYPAPNKWFRWCTQRMKINPTTAYIINNEELCKNVILVLGTRKAESTDRAKSMAKFESSNGSKLRKHTLPNSYVYAPLVDFSNDDVWTYLLQVPNFWGGDNKQLLTLYKNATGECPIVLETGTASCGNSRFGCWVCTVVRKDKSMENLIENGEEWMEDLLDFRNWLVDVRQQDNQNIPLFYKEKISYGPLLLKTRKAIFEKLLMLQSTVNQTLISEEEIEYIKILLKVDSETQLDNGLYEWEMMLQNQKKITLVADYNPMKSNRKRFGSISVNSAEILNSKIISGEELKDYESLTRVFSYYNN